MGKMLELSVIHGDLQNTKALLYSLNVIDKYDNWNAKQSILVQTGDILNRGPSSKGMIEFFRKLQSDAIAYGGKVILILGNHEIINLRDPKDEKLLKRYVNNEDLKDYRSWNDRNLSFSSEGSNGKFLRKLPLAIRVDNTLFIHGGLSLSDVGKVIAQLGLDGINDAFWEIADTDKYDYIDPNHLSRNHPIHILLSDQGILWKRPYNDKSYDKAYNDTPYKVNTEQFCNLNRQRLNLMDNRITRVVVGHTMVLKNGLGDKSKVLCKGDIVLNDVHVSRYMRYPDEIVPGNLGGIIIKNNGKDIEVKHFESSQSSH